jgi:hypothetical protein
VIRRPVALLLAALAALAAAALVIVAPVVVATAAEAAPSTDQARAIARTGMLVISDFPTGWTQSPRAKTADAGLDAAAVKIPSCRAFRRFITATRKQPRVQSPDFDDQQSNVSNSVSAFPSTAQATAAMHTFADRRQPTCLEQLYTKIYRAELTKKKDVAGEIASVRTSIQPVSGLHIGDEVLAYQGAVAVALKDGTTQSIGLGVVSVRVGSAVDGYSWTSDTDISAALQPAIVTSVARLQAAEPTS